MTTGPQREEDGPGEGTRFSIAARAADEVGARGKPKAEEPQAKPNTSDAGEGGNVAIFSHAEFAPLPESEWLSVGVIEQTVEQLVQPFRATQIPVRVIDTLADAGIVANPDDGVASGVTFKGRIHLVREGLAYTAAVERTLWRELLHFGLRRKAPGA